MQFRIQLTKSFGEEDGKVSAKRHRISGKKRCAGLRRNGLHLGFDAGKRRPCRECSTRNGEEGLCPIHSRLHGIVNGSGRGIFLARRFMDEFSVQRDYR